MSPAASRVLHRLSATESVTARVIAADLMLARSTVAKALTVLESAGHAVRVRAGHTTGPDTWRRTNTPPPVSTGTAPAVPDTGSRQRLGRGELRAMVAACFAEHPGRAYTPGDIARILDRSAGAVANAIQRLVAQELLTPAGIRPRRYRANPDA
ncbi:hypothetical protein Afil01_31310 [Actinorhabdospora filicis]|uniref:Uncharacterized protein n=2 Tax=Actinorhabdospora filicis TaxID=1785913 RepID=A0A9W6SM55_9ACTN|nr:hypothetical protein Afil01_31310 [Actinorhabdospora filicis]